MLEDEHKQKGERNFNFYNDLKENNINYTDWNIISLFYCAIHYVMWYLHQIVDESGVGYDDRYSLPEIWRRGRRIKNHPHRKKLVNNYFQNEEAQIYAFLELQSMKARYDVLDLTTLSQNDFDKCEFFVKSLQPFDYDL